MTMAQRMVIPVGSYFEGLLGVLQAEARRKLPATPIEFREIRLNEDARDHGKVTSNGTPLSAEDKQVIESAEIVVGDAPFLSKCLHLLKKAKWVHSIYAGVDSIVSTSTVSPTFTLTRHVGPGFGQQMGEYVLVQILARERNLFSVEADMQQCKWQWQIQEPRVLPSLSIGVLGIGSIGKKIAQMCKSMEMTVWGLTRTTPKVNEPYLDYSCQLPQLPQLLEACDYVCNVLPSTPQTIGLLDGDILKHCALKKSTFINVGRGNVVSETVLVRAITEGWLSGAILDVYATEPLPLDSKLWSTPGVTLTPHMSGLCSGSETASVFVENMQRYVTGQPLKYTVDFSRGY
jgi:phosphoglycerate dehydrogenase-like enzyme